MIPELSVVVPYRNRDLSRISQLHQSIQRHTKVPFELVVSDFGSQEPYQSQLAQLAQRENFRVVRSETQGLPWSRSKAINTGVRQAQAPLVAIVDADMVFHDSVLDHVVSTIGSQEVVFLESLWPQSPKTDPFRGRVHRSYGVFQVLRAEWFTKLNGFCEDIEFWGGEDNEWVRRLVAAGVELRWLTTQQFKLTHTWHPQENNPVTRPFTAVTETLRIEIANLVTPYQNPDWGRPVEREERPILMALTQKDAVWFDLGDEPLAGRVPEVASALRSGALVSLQLGHRVQPRRFTPWAPALLKLQDLFGPFSLRLDYKVSAQLEEFLTLVSILGKRNVDVYIDETKNQIHILQRHTAKGKAID